MADAQLVCCRYCRLFICDKVGDGGGLGRCRAYANFKAAAPTAEELRVFVCELGFSPGDAVVFWGGEVVDRACRHYVAAV